MQVTATRAIVNREKERDCRQMSWRKKLQEYNMLSQLNKISLSISTIFISKESFS